MLVISSLIQMFDHTRLEIDIVVLTDLVDVINADAHTSSRYLEGGKQKRLTHKACIISDLNQTTLNTVMREKILALSEMNNNLRFLIQFQIATYWVIKLSKYTFF